MNPDENDDFMVNGKKLSFILKNAPRIMKALIANGGSDTNATPNKVAALLAETYDIAVKKSTIR